MRKIATLLLTLTVFLYSIYPVTASSPPPSQGQLYSYAAVLIDADTGQVLYEKNKDLQMHPASITKIMTGMLALQNGDLSSVLTTSYNAVHSLPYNTSHIALSPDENITLEQALYGLAIESANDAANVIAENLAGSVENFATLMNDYAAQLGAVNTHFTNPHGLPDSNHYSTAQDMAIITAAALKVPRFNEIFSTRRYDIPPTNKKNETRQFWNADYFLNNEVKYDGIIMSKLGWTDEAQHTLVAACKRGDVTLIAVVMQSEKKISKYNDAIALFDYGFENYSKLTVSPQELTSNLPSTFITQDGRAVEIEQGNLLVDGLTGLAPADILPENIKVTYGDAVLNEAGNIANVPVIASAPTEAEDFIIGKTTLTAIVKEPLIEDTISDSLFAFAKKPMFILFNLIMWIVILCLVLVVIRRMIILENRRRRRKRQRQKQMRKNPQGYNKTTGQSPAAKRKLTPEEKKIRQAKMQAQKLKNQIYKD